MRLLGLKLKINLKEALMGKEKEGKNLKIDKFLSEFKGFHVRIVQFFFYL